MQLMICEELYTMDVYLPTLRPWVRVLRLGVENFDLMLNYAYGPICHALL